MDTGQSLVVVVTVQLDVCLMTLSHSSHHVLDVCHALLAAPHRLGREVGVAAGSVPVFEELGGERDGHIEVLGNALKKIPGDPKLVTHRDALYWSNLILPLTRHDLSVGARDLDSSIKAGSVMCISNDSAEAVVRANRAVEGSLGRWVTIVGPADRPGGKLGLCSDQSVLLLDAKPRLLVSTSIENSLGMCSEVCVGGGELLAGAICPLPSLGHHDYMVAFSERIPEVCDRFHNDF